LAPSLSPILRATPPAKAESPSHVAGLKLWLDASDPASQFADAQFTKLASGANGQLGGWKDKGPEGNHLAQGSAAARPKLVAAPGSATVVQFDGVASLLSRSGSSVPLTGPLVVYSVKKPAALSATRRKFAGFRAEDQVGWAIGLESNAASYGFTVFGIHNLAGTSVDLSTERLALSTDAFGADSVWRSYADGSPTSREEVQSDALPNEGRSPFQVGGSGASGEWWDGDIAELLVYAGEHDAAQRYSIEQYLLEKWDLPRAVSPNASAFLTTPTYDGSGQAVHPGVVHIPEGWNGYKYWMAVTPFAGSASTLENPSILCSDDGDGWSTPPGLTNPIVRAPTIQPPAVGWNSDPDLVMDADGRTLWMVYRESVIGQYDRLYVRSSTDGVNWSEAVLILDAPASAALSPSIVLNGRAYAMWVVDHVKSPGVIRRYTAPAVTGPWTLGPDMSFTNPAHNNPWHLCARMSPAGLTMLLMEESMGLFFLSSPDGTTWTYDLDFNLARGAAGSWDATQIYRSTFAPGTAGFDIWYSARSKETGADVWHVGRTRYVPGG
jgi:hypothetical protein